MSTYFLPNIVKHCDCNSPEGFDSIQSKSIDLIIGDFPYECTQNAWDKKKTFALDVTLSNCFRVLTKNGVLILFSKQPFTSKLVIQLEPYFKQEIIWVKEKPTNCFNANKLPLSIHENILVFSKGVPVYHPQKNKGKPYRKIKDAKKQGSNYGKDSVPKILTESKGDRFPTSVVFYARDFSNCGIHPTQKPMALLIWLIATFSDPGSVLCDPTLGSFSTILACVATNRRYIGFEIDDEYFSLGQKRLKNYQQRGIDDFEKPAKLDKNQSTLDNLMPYLEVNQLE